MTLFHRVPTSSLGTGAHWTDLQHISRTPCSLLTVAAKAPGYALGHSGLPSLHAVTMPFNPDVIPQHPPTQISYCPREAWPASSASSYAVLAFEPAAVWPCQPMHLPPQGPKGMPPPGLGTQKAGEAGRCSLRELSQPARGTGSSTLACRLLRTQCPVSCVVSSPADRPPPSGPGAAASLCAQAAQTRTSLTCLHGHPAAMPRHSHRAVLTPS